jgi:hypothetical protein
MLPHSTSRAPAQAMKTLYRITYKATQTYFVEVKARTGEISSATAVVAGKTPDAARVNFEGLVFNRDIMNGVIDSKAIARVIAAFEAALGRGTSVGVADAQEAAMQLDLGSAAASKLAFAVTAAPVKIGDTWHVAGQCMANLRVGDRFNEMAIMAKASGASAQVEAGRRSIDLRIKEIHVGGRAIPEWEAGGNARLILAGHGEELQGPCQLYLAADPVIVDDDAST